MSNLRMRVYTLMGLISDDIPLATIKLTDKKTKTERVFEMAVIRLNLPAVTLDGRVDEDNVLPIKQKLLVNMPILIAGEKTRSTSDEFRIHAEFIVIREKVQNGTEPQSWAFRVGTLTKGQQKKLIAASGLIDQVKGPIIPRFVMEVGAVRNKEGSLGSGYVMRPAGLYFTSKPAKGKSKGAKPRPA
ncbi:MAG: hypothetical protein K2Q32_04375 [Alphaproteobacteria bacterium]|nr:hypothetical protein [Alphaproteobacteria bacterium]